MDEIKYLVSCEAPKTVMTLSKHGIWVDPDIAVDDAAKAVLACIDNNIQIMIQAAINDYKEKLAKKIEKLPFGDTAQSFAIWVREQDV